MSWRQRLLWRTGPPLAVAAGAFALGLAVSSLAPARAGVPAVVRVVTEGHVLPSPTRLPVVAPAQPQDHQATSPADGTRPGRARTVPPATRPVPTAPGTPPAPPPAATSGPAASTAPAVPVQVPGEAPALATTPSAASSASPAPAQPSETCILGLACI